MPPFQRQNVLRDGRDLCIREAVESDAEAIVEHCERVGGETDFLGFGIAQFGITVDEERVFLREHPLKGNVMLVSLVEDSVVAVSNVTRMSLRDRLMHVGSLGISVQKVFWRLGVATHTMRALVEWSKGAGLRKLNLEVSVENTAAIGLYQKVGFEHEGRNRRGFQLNDQLIDTLWMGMLL